MLDTHLDHLRKVIAEGGGAREIDEALIPIVELNDPRSIMPLMLLFSENSDDDGMWSLLHTIEAFDHEIYLDSYVEAIAHLAAQAPWWASLLMIRILNSDATRAGLARRLRITPVAAKEAAIEICEKLNADDIRFLAKTTVVLIAARETV